MKNLPEASQTPLSRILQERYLLDCAEKYDKPQALCSAFLDRFSNQLCVLILIRAVDGNKESEEQTARQLSSFSVKPLDEGVFTLFYTGNWLGLVHFTITDLEESDDAVRLLSKMLERFLRESGADPQIRLIVGYPCPPDMVDGQFNELLNSVMAVIAMQTGRRVITELMVRESPSRGGDTIPQMEVERQLADSLFNLDFQKALSVMNRIMDRELSAPFTSLSLRPRLITRINWILLVLRLPRSRSDAKSAAFMAYPKYISDARDNNELRFIIQEFFTLLDEYYLSIRFNVVRNIEQITNYIRDNYNDGNLSATMLSDKFRISASYLSHMFKQKTGVKLIDFIHTVRIAHTKELLTGTNLGISEIATQTGYASSWSMTRAFKRYENMTPTEYRNAKKGH